MSRTQAWTISSSRMRRWSQRRKRANWTITGRSVVRRPMSVGWANVKLWSGMVVCLGCRIKVEDGDLAIAAESLLVGGAESKPAPFQKTKGCGTQQPTYWLRCCEGHPIRAGLRLGH